MGLMQGKKITITTLSPVHIGCGEEYLPTNFVIKDQLLHFLDMAAIADELTDPERTMLGNLQTVGAIQQFFKSKRERFAPLATHLVEVAAAIAQEYEDKAGGAMQRANGGAPTYNLLQILRTAFNVLDNAPYLPGSSLKGSMRTAFLNTMNNSKPLEGIERAALEEAKRRNKSSHNVNKIMQQRLLGYAGGKFENDPLRHLHIVDAHHDEATDPAPSQILYAVSKKKKISERGSPELKVFLEVIPGLLNNVFTGEIRLTSDPITWQLLCDACNDFYYPQLQAELNHAHLSDLLETEWKNLLRSLIKDEINTLRKNRQGFLLRVGKHSGAESLTLNGVRDIKILGKQGEPPDYRSETTEKRFASQAKVVNSGLLPFGWLWVEACDDAHQHVSISMHDKIQPHTDQIRKAQRQRLSMLEQAEKLAGQTEEEKQQQKEMQRQKNAKPWPGARIKFNAGNGALSVENDGKTAIAIAPRGEQLLQTLALDIQKKVRTNQYVKVTAYVDDRTLVRIE